MNLMNASGGWIASAIDLVRFRHWLLTAALLSLIVNCTTICFWIIAAVEYTVLVGYWITEAILHTGALEGSSSLLYVFDDGTVLALLFNGNSDVNFRRWLEPIIETTDWPDIDLFDQY